VGKGWKKGGGEGGVLRRRQEGRGRRGKGVEEKAGKEFLKQT